MWNCGWMKGLHTKKTAGVSIAMGRRWRNMIKEIYSPPTVLQGRGGTLRIKGTALDILLVAVYFPPAAYAESGAEVKCKATIQSLIRCLPSLLDRTPKRTIPLYVAT